MALNFLKFNRTLITFRIIRAEWVENREYSFNIISEKLNLARD